MRKVQPEKTGTWNVCNKEENNMEEWNMEKCNKKNAPHEKSGTQEKKEQCGKSLIGKIGTWKEWILEIFTRIVD